MKRWIGAAKLKTGAFSTQAKRAGMGTQAYARKVVRGRKSGHYRPRTVRRARLALQLGRMAKKR